jgi:hypothetical protein
LTRNPNGVETKITLQDLIMSLQTKVLPTLLRLEVDNNNTDLIHAKKALNIFRKELDEFEKRIRIEVSEEIMLDKSIDNEDRRSNITKAIEQRKIERNL